jgi:hypothetical protein
MRFVEGIQLERRRGSSFELCNVFITILEVHNAFINLVPSHSLDAALLPSVKYFFSHYFDLAITSKHGAYLN